METIMMTSFAIGGALVLPTLWEVLKPRMPLVGAVVATGAVVVLLSPLAPHSMWQSLGELGGLPGNAALEASNGLANFNSAYYDAMN